jgi:CheY-like chemotaxis protein
LVIGLTGHALAEDIAEYKAHGADLVLKKPIDMAEFFEAMGEYRPLSFG